MPLRAGTSCQMVSVRTSSTERIINTPEIICCCLWEAIALHLARVQLMNCVSFGLSAPFARRCEDEGGVIGTAERAGGAFFLVFLVLGFWPELPGCPDCPDEPASLAFARTCGFAERPRPFCLATPARCSECIVCTLCDP